MKSLLVLSALLAIPLLQTCDMQCGECFTPPEEIRLKLIDSQGNNLVENGTYTPDSISLYYLENQVKKPVRYDLSTYYPYFKNIIFSSELAWMSIGERMNYYLRLNYLDTDTLTLELKEKHSDCCTYFDVVYFTINGKQAEFSNTEYVFLIRKNITQ